MISADFYPNYYTYNSGNIITDTTNMIPVTTDDFPNMYYLGWIKPENVPQMFKMAQCTQQITADDTIYRWDTITPTDVNYNCGYLVKTPNGYANIQNYAILSRNASTGIWQHGDATDRNYNWAFPNKLDVMMEGTGLTQLAILACIFDSDDAYVDRWIWTGGGSLSYISFAYNDMLSFLYDDGSLQITSGNYTLTFKKSDFDDDGTLYKNFDNSQNKCKLFICGYNLSFSRDSNNDPTCCPSFFTSFTDINGKKWVTTGNWINYNQYWAEGAGMVGIWHGGYNGTLKKSELQAMISPFYSSASGKPYAYNGTVLAIRTDNNQTYWYSCIYPPDAIAKHYALTIRVSSTNQYGQPLYGYVENSVYAPYVTENNEFTATLITGVLTDNEFKSKLRPWQYDVNEWSENTYTEDDLPPYTPEGDDGTDSGGDDIRPSDWTNLRIGAANNFVTLYGMTAATVADFGRQMWANLADPAFWQMVGTVFTNDFSINPADMMKYFISLRYFPFDVSDFAHTTATGIYVGRAATPIAPSTGVAYPIRITNNVVQVDGGRLTISRYYNDFRDYEPCTTVQIHVPFCGSVDVPASEVMGHEMDLTYKIDLQTGAMLAVLGVASNTYYVIATLAGTCGASIPITANNNIEFLQRIATVGSGLIGGGISGGVKGAAIGGEVGAVVGAVAGTVGGGVGALAGLPPVTVHKQGNASGFANLGGVPYAYATVQRGRFERPANYGHTTGFACDFSATLGSLSGFTVCDNVDTSGLTCNADERDEIKRLLESGVYV